MKYRAILWACHARNGYEDEDTKSCVGHRYLEVGEDPGPCGHETIVKSEIQRCREPMDDMGEYELEAE